MTEPLAIIFVTTDESHLLIPALESLFSALPRRPLELVVVDNASADGAAEKVAARWPQTKILTQTARKSLAANLNWAMAETSSAYAMWCDADMVFRPGAAEALAAFLDERPRAGMVKPKLLSPEGEVRASARRWYTPAALFALRGPWSRWTAGWKPVRTSLYADWDYLKARLVDWLPFAGVMVRRRAYEEIGEIDERFSFYFEDVDFSLRMHQAGWEVWCHPGAEMVHLENRASRNVISRAGWLHLDSLVKFWWKHKGLRPKARSPRGGG